MKEYPKITLRAARVNADLTLEAAAKKLSITKETLRNYEYGKTTPDWNMVDKISKVYDFPSDYIFFGSLTRLKRNRRVT